MRPPLSEEELANLTICDQCGRTLLKPLEIVPGLRYVHWCKCKWLKDDVSMGPSDAPL